MKKGCGKNARILVVDDSPLSIEFLSSALKAEGFNNIDQAGSVKAAREKLYHANLMGALVTRENVPQEGAHRQYDLVFLDINLSANLMRRGVETGIDLLKEIRKDDLDTFVVMVSGEGTVDAIQDSVKAGASGFIAKPFSRARVSEVVHLLCDSKQ